MLFKEGVRLTGIKPQTVVALNIVDRIFANLNLDEPTCTSVNDGVHMTNSFHYKGLACDIRSKGLTLAMKITVFNLMKYRLQPLGFDCLWESQDTDNEHYHLEYDPK